MNVLLPLFSLLGAGCNSEETEETEETENQKIYPDHTVEVKDYSGLMDELSTVEQGDHAVVDLSATWCAPCREFKEPYEYLAKYDQGRHLWIESWEDDDVAGVLWNNWEEGETNVTLAPCWSGLHYFPQILVIEALGNEEYEAHEVNNRGSLFSYADDSDTDIIELDDGTELVFNENPATNELYQVELDTHDKSTRSARVSHEEDMSLSMTTYFDPFDVCLATYVDE